MLQRAHCLVLTVVNENSRGMHEGRAMEINLPVIAGTISTTIFALSTLPMLLKAFQTKDLRSYSLGNILLANAGNLIHCVYVFHLPAGPIWLLHSFYLLTTALMLVWYLRYQWRPRSLRALFNR
jgi:uncharacterized protein with PQ loop repeat